MMRALYIFAVLLILIGLAPMLGLTFGLVVSGLADCAINESVVNECRVLGADWGPFLTSLTVAGWLMLLSWPIAAAGFAMLLVLMILSLTRRIRSRRPD